MMGMGAEYWLSPEPWLKPTVVPALMPRLEVVSIQPSHWDITAAISTDTCTTITIGGLTTAFGTLMFVRLHLVMLPTLVGLILMFMAGIWLQDMGYMSGCITATDMKPAMAI